MKYLTVVVAFVLLAIVSASPSPFFHKHSWGRHHSWHHHHHHHQRPVAVREYVRVPEVHVQKVFHTVPVYVPVVIPAPVPVPVSVPVTTEKPVQVEVGGGVNVAANPGAVHVTKTKPVVVSV
ncbi:forkhead box protein B2-like [Anopheles nili]|uniref:forkhead box protein B2-like n=1 Tax=Anopheles nili TaxID=185578 RepID=UPI00237B25E5|nr:forkhead box protein B2-like [Anopheles nili]